MVLRVTLLVLLLAVAVRVSHSVLCDDALTTCLAGTDCCCDPFLFCTCCSTANEVCAPATGTCDPLVASATPSTTPSLSSSTTPSPSSSATPSPSTTPSLSPSATPSASATASSGSSPSSSASVSPSTSVSPSATPSTSLSPSATPSVSVSSSATATPAPLCASTDAETCTIDEAGRIVVGGTLSTLPSSGGSGGAPITIVLANATLSQPSTTTGSVVVRGTLVVRIPTADDTVILSADGGITFNASDASIAVIIDEPLARPCERARTSTRQAQDQRSLSVVVTIDTSACSGGGRSSAFAAQYLSFLVLAVVPLVCCCCCAAIVVLAVVYHRHGRGSWLFAARDSSDDARSKNAIVHTARPSLADGGRKRDVPSA